MIFENICPSIVKISSFFCLPVIYSPSGTLMHLSRFYSYARTQTLIMTIAVEPITALFQIPNHNLGFMVKILCSTQSKTLLFKTDYVKPYRLLYFINKTSCVHLNMNLKPKDTNQGGSGETLMEVIGRPGERKR